jgi:DNA repair protein RadC
LLKRFGTLQAVLAATPEELRAVAGVGEAAALDLKLLHEASVRALRAPAMGREVISSWTALLAYMRVALAHDRASSSGCCSSTARTSSSPTR